jgi:hypothetical protein
MLPWSILLIIVGARVFWQPDNATRMSVVVAIQESPSAGGSMSNAVQAPPRFTTTGELVVTPESSVTNRVETTMATRVSSHPSTWRGANSMLRGLSDAIQMRMCLRKGSNRNV